MERYRNEYMKEFKQIEGKQSFTQAFETDEEKSEKQNY